jgi:hypothetical protein
MYLPGPQFPHLKHTISEESRSSPYSGPRDLLIPKTLLNPQMHLHLRAFALQFPLPGLLFSRYLPWLLSFLSLPKRHFSREQPSPKPRADLKRQLHPSSLPTPFLFRILFLHSVLITSMLSDLLSISLKHARSTRARALSVH